MRYSLGKDKSDGELLKTMAAKSPILKNFVSKTNNTQSDEKSLK